MLVDNIGKKEHQLKGKTDNFKTLVFDDHSSLFKPGDWAVVKVTSVNTNTLFGDVVQKVEGIKEFSLLGFDKKFGI